jgi:hypothetical protein
MDDRKPSQFLRHLKGLATDVLDDFLRTIWASRLPPHVQAILAGQTEGSLESASHLTNRICEVTSLPTRARISPSKPDSTAGLLKRIEELSRQVASLRVSWTHNRSQSRGRHRSHSRDSHRCNPENALTPHDTCWYHRSFWDAGRKCTPQCSRQQSDFRQQENSASGR